MHEKAMAILRLKRRHQPLGFISDIKENVEVIRFKLNQRYNIDIMGNMESVAVLTTCSHKI